jgi:hypothetical protein
MTMNNVGDLRGVRLVCVGEDNSESGLVWSYRFTPKEGTPAVWDGSQWVELEKVK